MVCIIASTNAQKRHQFQFGEKVGKLHEFESELMADPNTAPLFERFNKNRKAQRAVNYTTLGLIGGTIGLVAILSSNSSYHNYDALIALGIGVIAAPATFLIGNAIAGGKKRRAKLAILEYYQNDLGYEDDPSLHLSIIDNGLGVVVRF